MRALAAVALLLTALLAAPVSRAQDAASQQQAAATAGQRQPQKGPRLAYELPTTTDCSPADLPQISRRGGWRSQLPRGASANTTIVTQLTYSRQVWKQKDSELYICGDHQLDRSQSGRCVRPTCRLAPALLCEGVCQPSTWPAAAQAISWVMQWSLPTGLNRAAICGQTQAPCSVVRQLGRHHRRGRLHDREG